MEVKINIEKDDEFNAIIKDGLKALTDDDKRDLIKEVFRTSLKETEAISSLFIKKIDHGYYKSNEPSQLLNDIIKSMNFDKELSDIKESLVDTLITKCDSFIKELIIEAIFDKMLDDHHRVSELAFKVIERTN